MYQPSTFRIYMLRADCLLLAVKRGSISWTVIPDPTREWEFMHGVVLSMLGAKNAGTSWRLAGSGARHRTPRAGRCAACVPEGVGMW